LRMQTRIRHDDKPRVNKHGQGRKDVRGERAWGTVGASAEHMGTGQGGKGDMWPNRREARGDTGDGGFSMAWHEILEKLERQHNMGHCSVHQQGAWALGRETRDHVKLDENSKEDSNAVDAKQAVCIRHGAHGAWAVREQG
jgi:hypothetical protein